MFSKRLKELRTKNNYSQEQLAKGLNISRTAISSYELGRNEPPYDVLVKIASLLDCDLNYLLGATDRYMPYYPDEDTPSIDVATLSELLNGQHLLDKSKDKHPHEALSYWTSPEALAAEPPYQQEMNQFVAEQAVEQGTMGAIDRFFKVMSSVSSGSPLPLLASDPLATIKTSKFVGTAASLWSDRKDWAAIWGQIEMTPEQLQAVSPSAYYAQSVRESTFLSKTVEATPSAGPAPSSTPQPAKDMLPAWMRDEWGISPILAIPKNIVTPREMLNSQTASPWKKATGSAVYVIPTQSRIQPVAIPGRTPVIPRYTVRSFQAPVRTKARSGAPQVTTSAAARAQEDRMMFDLYCLAQYGQ